MNNRGQPANARMHPANKAEAVAIIEQMPIQFSHRVIMACIEEIKLRGLRHPHLFRNAFHAPSVEAALQTLANPRKAQLFSVKMMRIDTVAGLLTTALSRTYPPLIPPQIQEMFQSPNGRFFFELLGMLPELNRYLFVEILDLCCAIVDQQSFNQISHSKLAVFPGSCCFGLNEYMPIWDTRYLMSADLRRFSSAFYHAIYAYRDERDLTEEELQEKLDTRARILEEERIAALEREHGYRGAQAILRMEARIAQGLPAESPNQMKEISLYADRKEKVVADDAISVLDIQLDDDEDGVSKVPDLDRVQEEEEEEEEVENVQLVLKDLRRSISVASLGQSLYENQPRASPVHSATLSARAASPAPTMNSQGAYLTPSSPSSSQWNPLSRSNTVVRTGSLKLHPVSPGDIFGISQRAVEKRELEAYMAAARSFKRKKTAQSKRSLQQRQWHKMAVLAQKDAASSPSTPITVKAVRTIRRIQRQQPRPTTATVPLPSQQSIVALPTAATLRRERAKQFRKELHVYLEKGLSFDEAVDAREADIKRQKRRERRTKRAQVAKEEAEKEAAAAAAVADAIAQYGLTVGTGIELSPEETEILEAFDYLTDEEFQEFMELAGLTVQVVDAIRAKEAALSISKVTKDIQDAEIPMTSSTAIAVGKNDVVVESEDEEVSSQQDQKHMRSFDSEDIDIEVARAAAPSFEPRMIEHRRTIAHMTSMDLLFKHASVIGDANLRLYPTRPSSPTISDYESDSMHGGLLSRAASVMKRYTKDGEVAEEDDEEEEDERLHRPRNLSRSSLPPTIPMATRPTLMMTKAIPFEVMSPSQETSAMMMEPQPQANNPQHPLKVQLTVQGGGAVVTAVPLVQNTTMEIEAIEYTEEYDSDSPEGSFHEQKVAAEEVEETEDEAELRELLESMTVEERNEFLRLSKPKSMSMNPEILVQY
ncbi:hypothetical protein BGZ83_005123 [Gryganskiella cystojenkinii]|nr:hypothetical protein BGZ83_005123 [Gryganskiella cystojenkinii]